MSKERNDIEKRFYALSDRRRVTLLEIIGSTTDTPLSVKELGAELSRRYGHAYSQPAITFHLAALADAGLIEKQEKGMYVYCHLCPGVLSEMVRLIEAIGYQEIAI